MRWMQWKKKQLAAFHRFSYKNSLQNSQHFSQNLTAKITAFLKKTHRIWFPKFMESDLNSQEILTKNVREGAVE